MGDINNKPNYVVDNQTKWAALFDQRTHMGTGARKLGELREKAPQPAEVIDALWHQCSHVNGLVFYGLEPHTQLVKYLDVSPSKMWGKATEHAREGMRKTMLDPKLIIASRPV